jgi:lipopolysaccharide transport system permease protein
MPHDGPDRTDPTAFVAVRRSDDLPGWTEIRPPRNRIPRLELRGAWDRRDLALVLAQRTLKLRYQQTFLGIGWAVIQPLAGLAIFAVVFGRIVGLQSEGLPYAVFVYPALCVWTYVSTSVTAAALELVEHRELITKVYFPRLLSPAGAMLPGVVDLLLALGVTAILLVVYDLSVSHALILLPVWLLSAALVALAAGVWLSAINVRYRDVRHALPFMLQIWFFASPIVYPSDLVVGASRWLYAVNPLVGVIDGLRWSLIGAPAPPLADLVSLLVLIVVLVSGLYYFRSVEGRFADVI